jgi:anti-sigma-K factor RskA
VVAIVGYKQKALGPHTTISAKTMQLKDERIFASSPLRMLTVAPGNWSSNTRWREVTIVRHSSTSFLLLTPTCFFSHGPVIMPILLLVVDVIFQEMSRERS